MKIIFKFSLILTATLGVTLGHYFKSSKIESSLISLRFEDFAKACKQESTGRLWRRVQLDTLFSIRGYDGNPIFYPLKVYVDKDSNIYVLDVHAPAVLKFSPRGIFLKKFGKGRGQGPGEFQSPIDFSVSFDGYIYVSDIATHLVTIFDPYGNVLKALRTDGIPGHIAGISKREFVVQRFGVGKMFQKYSVDGNLLSSFGEFLKEQYSYAIPIGVKMVSVDKEIYCAFVMGGYILAYDVNGALKYFCETIDRFPFPEMKVTQSREKDANVVSVTLDPNAPVSALDISVSDSLLYILAGTASKKEGGVVIDVYHKNNGRYLYSFKFSKMSDTEGVQSCVVSGEYIYTAEILKDGNTCVRKYKFKVYKD